VTFCFIDRCQHIGGTCCLSVLNMDATHTSEMTV